MCPLYMYSLTSLPHLRRVATIMVFVYYEDSEADVI